MGTVPPPPDIPPEPVEEAAVEQTASEEQPSPAPRPRRGRLPLLLASAALLGIVAGVTTGYTIQADRKPTALPPLSQHTLAYPKKRLSADEVTPLPAKHDHRVKTNGDLRKLLLPKPKGAQDSKVFPSRDGWAPLALFLDDYESPDFMFSNLVEKGFRRVARRAWEGDGNREVLIELVQFDDAHAGSVAFLSAQQDTMTYSEAAGDGGSPLKGSEDGRYWVFDEPDRQAGYLPLYTERALARRGDIVMDVYVFDSEPLDEKTIRELAERQLERL